MIRERFLLGIKLSIAQFSELLGEPKYNIQAYETGRANIPNRILVNLYEKGINPTFILTGEGSAFASNSSGRELQQKYLSNSSGKIKEAVSILEEESETNTQPLKGTLKGSVSLISSRKAAELSISEILTKAEQITVAADDIVKILNEKKKKSAK